MIGRPLPLAALFFLTAFLLFAGCSQPVSAPAVPMPTTAAGPQAATEDEMVAFVQEAVAYAHAHGKEAALSEFSDRNGSFFRGELYIYAYDFNGTTIAHPVNPEMIGRNRLNERDAEGSLFIAELRDAAASGSGFVTYTYINPVHGNAVEKKLGYVMKAGDDWWLGSGIYLPE
jgi:cytochrome c